MGAELRRPELAPARLHRPHQVGGPLLDVREAVVRTEQLGPETEACRAMPRYFRSAASALRISHLGSRPARQASVSGPSCSVLTTASRTSSSGPPTWCGRCRRAGASSGRRNSAPIKKRGTSAPCSRHYRPWTSPSSASMPCRSLHWRSGCHAKKARTRRTRRTIFSPAGRCRGGPSAPR